MQPAEIAYFTENVNSMTEFYRTLFGKEPETASESMAIFMAGDTKLFIHRNYTAQEGELPPENHVAYSVDDVDATCRLLASQGIIIENEPADYYWGRSAYLRDPGGQLIELIQVQKPAA
jgi:catechol 2,3-dioxygenase-like lactoylglutathione lyase family enzyme